MSAKAEQAPALIDAAEVARRLKVAPDTVLEWAQAGKIPCLRISRRTVRFDWEAVRKALEARG